MHLKGVIFDLDGVLIPIEGFQWQDWMEALKKFGVSLSKKEYLRYAGKTGCIFQQKIPALIRFSLCYALAPKNESKKPIPEQAWTILNHLINLRRAVM